MTSISRGTITLTHLNFGCKTLERSDSLAISDLPVATLNCLLQYGTRRINDAFNSSKKEDMSTGELATLWESLLDKAVAGELGERTAVYNPDGEFKKFVFAVLRQHKVASKVIKEINGLTVAEGLKIVFVGKTKAELGKIEAGLRAKWEEEQKRTAELLSDLF